jgi:hypothetical protein
MAIDTEGRQMVEYFIGTEVENTIMKGAKTLFVVGIKPVEEIISLLTEYDINHVYFGTSQSFTPHNAYDWTNWDEMITPLLVKDFWVTLDFDVQYAQDLHEEGWCEYHNFIPMISVKLPYIRLYNYNATIKIDDKTWGHSNAGVWCHPLNELMTRETFSGWHNYTGDTPVFPQEESK